jgi:hypothetical protein
MTLAQQMVDDATSLLINTDEHATTIKVRDHLGAISSIGVIIEQRHGGDNQTHNGRNLLQRATVGLPSSYPVTPEWSFNLDADGEWWAVENDIASIEDDSAGWLWVHVVRSPILTRGNTLQKD